MSCDIIYKEDIVNIAIWIARGLCLVLVCCYFFVGLAATSVACTPAIWGAFDVSRKISFLGLEVAMIVGMYCFGILLIKSFQR